MRKLEKWLQDLQKKGFEFITIGQILCKIAEIERESVLKRKKYPYKSSGYKIVEKKCKKCKKKVAFYNFII